MQHLAPTRQDLLMRLARNGLPLGIKRVAWAAHSHTTCPNCSDNLVETAAHLFYNCKFAKDLWIKWGAGWRTQRGSRLSWTDLITAKRVSHLSWNKELPKEGGILDQVWAIIKGCVIRVIWLERNRRVFHPATGTLTSNHRSHQAMEDIGAHLASIIRRTRGTQKSAALEVFQALQSSTSIYSSIVSRAMVNHRQTNQMANRICNNTPQPVPRGRNDRDTRHINNPMDYNHTHATE